MSKRTPILKRAVASVFLMCLLAAPLAAQTDLVDDLLGQLAEADPSEAPRIEAELWVEWSRSGSASVDLLLERGREALEEDAVQVAIEHFTAVVDHAPDFAEGYNARATAYYRAGLYGPAMNDIGVALALNPKHFGAMSGLAIVMEELGYEDEALDALRQVAEIYPAREGLSEQIERLEGRLGGSTL
ncbi:MAG: hypothetical protein AAFN59_02735 [Pseudomonadota bacterium]